MNVLPLLTASALAAFPLLAQTVEASLYRPPAKELVLTYAPSQLDEHKALKPMLHLYGRAFPAGKATLDYTLLAGKSKLHTGKLALSLPGETFDRSLQLEAPFPAADRVTWTFRSGDHEISGQSPLRWARFHGRVEYADGHKCPSFVYLYPLTFQSDAFIIPVAEDGGFDVQVPARIYGVLNADGAGYAVDSLERWGWNFDLTRDREEVFRVGRMELYGMHARTLVGGPTTVFLAFRPTALTRVLRHVADPKAGPKDAATMALVAERLKVDPMAIAPDLHKENLKVWLDGVPQTIVELDRIPEAEGDGMHQTQYLLQFIPPKYLTRGVHHEIKLEAESSDVLNGKAIRDFGQGSTGLFLD